MTINLSTRDQSHIWHPYTQAKIAQAPIAIARAQGSYLYTDDGQKLFDGISSWWTNAHGHCHPYITKAIHEQLQTLDHVIFATFTHEPAVRLAELLLEIAPKNLRRVFYSDNGSTAVEVALKMAFQYWQHRREKRRWFITLEHGYHGDTFGAMSVSERGLFTKPFWPLLFEVIKTKSPCVSEISDEASEEMLTKNALSHLAAILERHRGEVAGIMLEPMLQAAGGMRIFTKGFLSGIAKLCKQEDILLIADEVATGFYRTGTAFAVDHEEVKPDILCLAKALTGGVLPLSATLATEEIWQAFLSDSKADALLHGHSFAGNPIGCAAGRASLELFLQPETQSAIKNICQAIEQNMRQFDGLPSVKHARHIGTIAAIELATDSGGYLSKRAEKIIAHCFARGLYLRPLGNIIYLFVPLCTTPEEIAWALQMIREGLDK